MTPLGVRTVGWKAPTETEKARDYLWRIHLQIPASGEIVVFNRSQYEDVLVPVVNQWITPEQQTQRYAQINDFERMLSETGTVIVKFMLHISKDEQRQRLQERLDDPCKHWKFDEGDLKVRAQWNEYQQAYAQLLAATHALGALDHRARGLQDAPQSDDCHRAARGSEQSRAEISARRTGAGEDQGEVSHACSQNKSGWRL